ncbi:MAG TPA: ribosome maturation factor RimP [Rubricoccaceae bacterium]|nr:ribosome maturation factor RimP [Rubricoccaceae bacterium]
MTHPENDTPDRAAALDARVRALAEEALADLGLFVVDVQVRGRAGDRVIEVFADSDTGVDLAALTEASRRLGFLLDAEEAVVGPYRLDVSSPGADRPLVPRQLPRHVGRTLRVSYTADAADPGEEVTVTGVLRAVRADAITVEHTDGTTAEIPTAALRDARVVLPW